MEDTHKTYLPAAGHAWLLPLYDPMRLCWLHPASSTWP